MEVPFKLTEIPFFVYALRTALFSLSPSNKTRKKEKKKTTTTKIREERIHVSFSIGSKWIDFLDHYFNIDSVS